MTTQTEASSYLDYETLLDPTFSPTSFANNLVLQTNNANDTNLDLATPLSRVLFDLQEVDTHIDSLTTQNAVPVIEYTRKRSEASGTILGEVEEQVKTLNESYQRLEKEVIERHEVADQVRLAAERMLQTLRLGRSVQRVVQLGRTLQGQMDEVGREGQAAPKGNWRSFLPATNTILSLRQVYAATDSGAEGERLGKVQVANALRTELLAPAERTVLNRAQTAVREFSMSSLLAIHTATGAQQSQTFAQAEETKARATTALQTLYLLSPMKNQTRLQDFEPTLLISALQSYLQTALTSSLAALSRALATLPTLDRTLLEISARCQNIVALEALLESIRPPSHPLLQSSPTSSENKVITNFLQPLLRHLDTSSLPSYFWRSLASQLSSRVQDILTRGGVSARTLRTNRDRVREAIRECVDRGSQIPSVASRRGEVKVGNWEREAAVMVGSVIGPLGR